MDTSTPPSSEPTSVSSAILHAALLERARLLLADVTAFQAYLQSQHKELDVDIRHFKSGVQSEAKGLERLAGCPSTGDTSDVKHSYGGVSEVVDEELELKRLHVLRSSNLPFYEAVWSAATKCRGVRALGKRMHWSIERRRYGVASPEAFRNGMNTKRSGLAKVGAKMPKKKNVLIDIIADDGAEWVKVSTITEKRLLFEMAKEGWEAYGDESGSDAHSSSEDGLRDNDRSSGLELVKLAEEMKDAARAIRVQYRNPRVRLILPKIREAAMREVDGVISDLRATGAIVQCASDHFSQTSSYSAGSIPLSRTTSFSHMLPTSLPQLTSVLNLDCTILLALISDISHLLQADLPTPPQGAYHSAIVRQIATEVNSPLLLNELYPVIVGRDLRCTQHAARRMREIVKTMGTPAERSRAAILLGEPLSSFANMSSEELCAVLTEHTAHPVPQDLHLPIVEISFDADAMLTQQQQHSEPAPPLTRALPVEAARTVIREMNLSEINRSVFLYGWDEEIVTVTSNRVVAVGIERVVVSILDKAEAEAEQEEKAARIRNNGVRNARKFRNALDDDDDYDEEEEEWEGNGTNVPQLPPPVKRKFGFIGPDIWICGTARSLIGKDKGRREGGVS